MRISSPPGRAAQAGSFETQNPTFAYKFSICNLNTSKQVLRNKVVEKILVKVNFGAYMELLFSSPGRRARSRVVNSEISPWRERHCDTSKMHANN